MLMSVLSLGDGFPMCLSASLHIGGGPSVSAGKDHTYVEETNQNKNYLFRFRDTRAAWPHLVNAGKYSSGIITNLFR